MSTETHDRGDEPHPPDDLDSLHVTLCAGGVLAAVVSGFYVLDVGAASLGLIVVFALAVVAVRRIRRRVDVDPSFAACAELVVATVLLAVPLYAVIYVILFATSVALHNPWG